MNWQDESIASLVASMKLRPPLSLAKTEPFEQAFLGNFPEGAIDSKAISEIFHPEREYNATAEGNQYLFKVSLDEQVWRKIKASSAHSLHHLHQAIQDSFELYDDHLYVFFRDGKPWSKKAFWAKESGDKPVVIDGRGEAP